MIVPIAAPQAGQPDLQVRAVSKRFGGIVALDQSNLGCFAGEVHGLVGENGAGKSTLVKVLGGAVRPDSGEVWLNGSRLPLTGPRAAIASGIAMVFQELSLIPDLTVAQNVFFGFEPLGRLRAISRKRLRESCADLFSQLGVNMPNPDREVRLLSLAERQLVEIAKAISHDSQVVVFDEATSALGRGHKEWLVEYCRRLADKGKIIVFISHHLAEVRSVADRLTVFRNGRDVGVRRRGEASIDELVSLMVGRRISRMYPPRDTAIDDQVALEVEDLNADERLHSVSFRLRRGEILGVGGLTGQGQDVLFRALFGIEPGTGTIKVGGRLVSLRTPKRALAKFGIALVPEDRSTQGLLLSKSIAANIYLCLLASRGDLGLVDRRHELTTAEKMIALLGIRTKDLHEPVRQLSGGNQQKVLLAKLLAVKPKVLLLFDSTRGVDVGTKAEIYLLLRELSKQGISILFYSTDSDELLNLADRVLVIRQGRIESELRGAQLTDENLIRSSVGESLATLGG